MSIRVMTKVWDTSQQSGSALLLLLALADHAADDGFCWPGVERLAHKIRMSERSVTRLLKTLEEDGDLHVIRQNGQHNWYVVRVGMSDQDVIETLKQRRFDTPDNLSPLTPPTVPTDTATPEPLTQLCQPNHHKPSVNHQKEPPAADSPPPSEEPFYLEGETSTAPRQRHTVEECKAATRKALEANARNGNGRAAVADASIDPWLSTAQEFSALIITPFENVPDSRRRMWANDIREIVEDSETGKGPGEVCRAIRSISTYPAYEWLRSANRPTHRGFADALLAVLWGQALPEKGNGSPSTPRTAPSGYRVMPSG